MPLTLSPRSATPTSLALPAPLRIEHGSAVIGRAPDADLVIAHPLVSGRHCMVSADQRGWQIADSSTNGTSVNGRRVSGPQALRDGDVIGLGEIELAVRIDDVGDKTRIQLDRGETTAEAGAPPASGGAADQLLRAAGIDRAAVRASDADILQAAGAALRASVEGLGMMVQARRKARDELGVARPSTAATPLDAPSPATALAALLSARPDAARAQVANATRELDAHQRATLSAMQAAFRAALDQFAPEAIKLRARDDAAAWKAYEKAFAASDGFVEVFARELGRAYERSAGSD